MTVSLTNISADTGEIYDAVDGGTTAVTSIITRAQSFVTNAGGSASDDAVVRPLADAMVCNQVMGGVDSVNKTIGTLTVGNKDMRSMRDYFKNEADKAAVIKGYSLDGLTILFEDSEN
jgi:hypothetical protein